MEFDKDFLSSLIRKAAENPRLRQNFDLRTSGGDTSQRMLNALLPGTVVPIHRHTETSETVVCLQGKLDEVIFEETAEYSEAGSDLTMDSQYAMKQTGLREVRRIRLCPAEGRYGCQIPQGAWHTVEVIEPSVIFEAKDGAYKSNQ